MNLHDLKQAVKASCATQSFFKNELVFDFLSRINEDLNKDYPVPLLKPPRSTTPDINGEYKNYTLELFGFNVHHSDSERELSEVWAEIEDALDLSVRYLTNNYMPNIIRLGEITWVYGHPAHNDILAGVQAIFDIKVFKGCYV